MKRKAFTLIELLVVVAVIGILASTLLPARLKAESSADRAICVNNLRQTAMSLRLYAEDHSDVPPFTNQVTLDYHYSSLFLEHYATGSRHVAR